MTREEILEVIDGGDPIKIQALKSEMEKDPQTKALVSEIKSKNFVDIKATFEIFKEAINHPDLTKEERVGYIKDMLQKIDLIFPSESGKEGIEKANDILNKSKTDGSL